MSDHDSKLDRLRKAAPHVAHDMQMLRDAWAHRSSPFAYTAWFIHCRSVMDFLDGRGTNPDDIRARDYFDDSAEWEKRNSSLSKPPDYEDYRTAVHKLAAHLTYTRIEYAEKQEFAPSADVHDYLLGRCALFIRLLTPERLVWFGGLGL